jgi:hypothetical protein
MAVELAAAVKADDTEATVVALQRIHDASAYRRLNPLSEQRVEPTEGPGKLAAPTVTNQASPFTRVVVVVCGGCDRPSENITGAYCPTCRQRGGRHGWCGCGAALYSDGKCGRKARHRKMRKAAYYKRKKEAQGVR